MTLTTPQTLQIALFGTSADPPTAGHQAILAWLVQNYDQVAVWASNNPFKQHRASLDQRLEMLRLLITEINLPQPQICLKEELSDHRSLISVQRAETIWGAAANYTIVIGADLVKQMPSWYKIEELLKRVKLLIIPRAGYTIASQDLAILRQLGSNYTIAAFQVPAVSSSRYRQQGDENVLTESVAAYIKQNKLYQ